MTSLLPHNVVFGLEMGIIQIIRRIAEPDTSADRKKRGRFSARFSLHSSFRQLLCFPGGG